MLDFRAIVRIRMIEVNGGQEDGALTHLAGLVAPRWDVLPQDALSRLSRYFKEHRDMKGEQLAHVLDVLSLAVVPQDQVIQENRSAL